MTDLPKCTQCGSEYTYEDGVLYICPECGHEWPIHSEKVSGEVQAVVKDAHGNPVSSR